MEEMLLKIEDKNSKIDSLEMQLQQTISLHDKKQHEYHVTNGQLRKLIGHLQSGTPFASSGGHFFSSSGSSSNGQCNRSTGSASGGNKGGSGSNSSVMTSGFNVITYEEMVKRLDEQRVRNEGLAEQVDKLKTKLQLMSNDSSPCTPMKSSSSQQKFRKNLLTPRNTQSLKVGSESGKVVATTSLSNTLKSASSTEDNLKSVCKQVAKQPPLPVAKTQHSIPHRFSKQTNFDVTYGSLIAPNVTNTKAMMMSSPSTNLTSSGSSKTCAVCFQTIAFGKSMSVCKFCPTLVHPTCEAYAKKDCGLTSNMALILNTNTCRSKGVLHRGYLLMLIRSKFEDGTSSYEWRSVGAEIMNDYLFVIRDLNEDLITVDLKVCGKKKSGGVRPFLQSSVDYTELMHHTTQVLKQMHLVFKLGRLTDSNTCKTPFTVVYLQAKSWNEKQVWLNWIEKIFSEQTSKGVNSPRGGGKKGAGAKIRDQFNSRKHPSSSMKTEVMEETEKMREKHCEKVVSLDLHVNVFTCLVLDDVLYLGTSQGIFIVEYKRNFQTSESPKLLNESIILFQMKYVESLNLLLAVTTLPSSDIDETESFKDKRRLTVFTEFRLPNRDLNSHHTIDSVDSCHLFEYKEYDSVTESGTYICAVSDCRVSILRWDNISFNFLLVYAFSTDKPTLCVTFQTSLLSVLVVTDHIYKIELNGFAVSQFLNDEDPVLMNHFRRGEEQDGGLKSINELDENRLLLCFTRFALVVNNDGSCQQQNPMIQQSSSENESGHSSHVTKSILNWPQSHIFSNFVLLRSKSNIDAPLQLFASSVSCVRNDEVGGNNNGVSEGVAYFEIDQDSLLISNKAHLKFSSPLLFLKGGVFEVFDEKPLIVERINDEVNIFAIK